MSDGYLCSAMAFATELALTEPTPFLSAGADQVNWPGGVK